MNSSRTDNLNPSNKENDFDPKVISRSEPKLPALVQAESKERTQRREETISPVKPTTLFTHNSMAELNTVQLLASVESSSHIKSPAQNSRKSQITFKTNDFNQKSMSVLPTAGQTGQKDNVKVVIRVRPQNEREKAIGGQKSCIAVESEEKIVLDRGAEQKMFTFDFVADENTSQSDIFERMAKPIADSCLQGYNGTIFAYGQTGSGKTYTIQGPAFTSASGEDQIISNSNASGQLFEGRGLMQRSFEHIFESMENERQEAERNGSEVKYLVKTSYLEIYNETILDLLDPSQTNLHIREDIKTGVYVEGLVEEPVQSVKDMIALISRGSRNRHVGSTNMNKESSRSHSVLTTQIESKCMTASGVWQMKSSCFHIIDLAGSERSKQTNAEGQRLKEAGMINKSLSALGIVINSLVEISEGRTRHVHYRDSKLTFLLRDSLGGNSKTVIIANITQAASSAAETLSTLKFAQRAKLIKNKAVINEESSGTIALLKTEIKRLKQEIIEISNNRLQIEQKLLIQGDATSGICAMCMAEKATQNDDKQMFQDEMLIEDNYRSKTSVTNGDSKIYQQRVAYLENLLSANLDNLTSSQKYYEAEMAKKAQSIKWFQQAIDSFEKQSQRDKMIIKFRDQRIQKLEQALANTDTSKCRSCEVTADQIVILTEERDNWKDQYEKQANAQAAKLFAEKSELIRQKESLERELKQTPDSLSAQIRSLNELNDNLNQYLKDHCEQKIQDSLIELEQIKVNLQDEVESLKAQMIQSNSTAETILEQVKTQHQVEINQMQDKLTQMYERHIAEKTQLQQEAALQMDEIKVQLQSVSQGTEFQFTRLKIESLEKQNELQTIIDAKDKQLHAREESLAQLDITARQLREAIEKSTLSHLQTTEDLNQRISNLQSILSQERDANQAKVKHLRDEHSRELTQLQKDLLVEQSQGDFLREQDTEQKKRISDLEVGNEDLQKQMLLGLETIQELRAHVSSIEAKLAAITKEYQAKILLAQSQEQQWKEHSQMMSKKAAEIEKGLTKDLEEYQIAKEKQTQDLLFQIEKQVQEKQQQVRSFELQIQNQQGEHQAQIQRLEQKLNDLLHEHDQQTAAIELKMQLNSQEHQDQRMKLEQDLERLRLENQEYVDSLQMKNSEISQSLLKCNNELAMTHQELERVSQLNQELTGQLSIKQQLLDTTGVEVRQLKQNLEELSLEHQRQKLHYQTIEATMEKQLVDQKKAQNSSIAVLTQSFEEQIKAHQEALKLSESNYKALSNQSSNQKTDFDLQKQRILNQLKLVEVENQDFQAQVFSLKSENERLQQQYQQKLEQIELNVKLTLENEKRITAEQTAIMLQEQLALKEKDVKNSMLKTFQTHMQEQKHLHETELNNTRKRASLKLKSVSATFLDCIKQLRSEFIALKRDVSRSLQWEYIVPSVNEIQQLVQSQVQSRTEKEGRHIWEVQSLKALHQKALQAQQAAQSDLKQSVSDLNEQLNEYKGLTTQLQVEKQATLQSMDVLAEKLRVATLALGELKQAKQESEVKLNQERVQQINERESQIQALTTEMDTLRNNLMQKTVDLTKLRSKHQDVQAQLQQNKNTINDLLSKEENLMGDVQSRVTSLVSETELWKQKVADQKKEIAELKKSYESLNHKYEIVVSQSKDLVLARDYENETKQTVDRQRQQELEAVKNEIQQYQLTVSKQDSEIKEVVKLLKKYSDDNKQLQWENEQLRQQNEIQVGHQNLQQKIQHHQKIKEENNKLRVDNYNLKEELRKKFEMIGNAPQNSTRQNTADQELDRVKRDCASISQNIDQVLQTLTQMPGIIQYLKMMPQLGEQLKKASQPASSSSQAAFNSQQKSNVAFELIGHLGRQLQQQIQQQQSDSGMMQANLQRPSIQTGQQRTGSSSGLRQVDPSKRVGTLYLNPGKGPSQFQ